MAPATGPVRRAGTGRRLKSDGSVISWGCAAADYGQCTVPAGAGSGVTAIAAGWYHSLALKSDGSVIAWGCVGADFGQCTVPAAATSGVTAIAAGVYHSLALKSGGSVQGWGCSSVGYGECMVPASAGSGVIAIAAGEYHSLALGTPPTAVAVKALAARWTGRLISVSWRTATELQTLGFNVYRKANTGPFRRVNAALIAGKRTGSARGAAYSFADRAVLRGTAYTYRMQVVAQDGARRWYGIAQVRLRY